MMMTQEIEQGANELAKFLKLEAVKNVLSGMSRGLDWLPWAPSTMARKERIGGFEGLVGETRQLLDRTDSEVVDKSTVILFNDMPYAWYHEYGTSTVPMRPFLRPAVLGNKKEILKIFRNALKKVL